MTAVPVGTIVKSLATQSEWLVVGYRDSDDTAMCTDTDAYRMARVDCSSADMVVTHQWDSEAAAAYRSRLRLALLDHVGKQSEPVAHMISEQLDHLGEVWSF